MGCAGSSHGAACIAAAVARCWLPAPHPPTLPPDRSAPHTKRTHDVVAQQDLLGHDGCQAAQHVRARIDDHSLHREARETRCGGWQEDQASERTVRRIAAYLNHFRGWGPYPKKKKRHKHSHPGPLISSRGSDKIENSKYYITKHVIESSSYSYQIALSSSMHMPLGSNV